MLTCTDIYSNQQQRVDLPNFYDIITRLVFVGRLACSQKVIPLVNRLKLHSTED